MKTRFGTPMLILAALIAPAAQAETSSYGCSALDTTSSLPSVEGLNGYFYRVLADLRMRHPMEDAVMKQMAALSEALATSGTTLIYVAVPTKSQAMPQFLPPLAADYAYDSATATLVYEDIVGRLSAHGVLAPNILQDMLTAPADTPPFFQADFHWTSDGARMAARVIGEMIKAQPTYADLSPSQYKTTELAPTAAFSTMRRTLQGLCIDELPRVEAVVHKTELADGPAADITDIFAGDDQAVQAVLVGTSFSDSALGNFGGFLSESSGLDVVNYAVTGGNQFGAMTSYLTSRDFAENPPHFLIWENPIYSNLAQFGPEPLDELIAAAGQTCTTPLPATPTGANSLTADLTGVTIAKHDAILADLGTDGPREATFTLATVSGVTRNALMQRTDRMLASGRFFKPMDNFWHPDLKTLTVTFDRPVKDTSTLILCHSSRKDAS